MSNQINLKDGETLTWAIYENGSGVLSLVLFAETITHARPSPAFFVHRYYLTPAECETYEAGRHMVRTYDDGLNLVLKLVSRV